MPWIKLTDDWYEDPAMVQVGDAEMLLWVVALSWSARNLTDGHVPVKVAAKLTDARNVATVAGRLVAVGLFVEDEGGWLIANYHKYQPTRESVLARRAADAERKAAGRAAKSKRSPAGQTDGLQAESVRPGPVPVPKEIPSLISGDHPVAAAVLDAVAELMADAAKPTNRAKWTATVRASLDTDDRHADLRTKVLHGVQTWDEPAHVIAAWATGTRDSRYLKRRSLDADAVGVVASLGVVAS